MSSFYLPAEPAFVKPYGGSSHAFERCGQMCRTHSSGCKRKHEVCQEVSPMQSAFAFPGTHTSDGVSYGSGCTANRSASMDSDISSWSPVPKRHCFYSLQPLSNCVSAHSDSEQGQQLGPALQQPATADASTTANVDRATALRALLSQRSPEEAEALLTYLHRLQRLRQAAASQHSQAQLLHQSFPQTVKQSAQKASASTLIKLQAAFHHVMQSQHTHQASSKLHQHMVDSDATDSIHPSADSFLSQLQEIQTPLQHHEDHSSVISYPQGEAVFWRSNRHAPSDADTAVYEAVQPQAEVFQSAYQSAYQYSQPCQRACQSDCMWQSASSCTQTASTACEQYSSQAPDAHVANHLLQLQQQARVVQQLAQEKRRLLMQQHVAREQQAFLERQVALPPVRPALSFPELVAYWAKGLSLQRCESVYLACHLWTRVQQQVSIAYMHLLGAEKPWETMLMGCLWLAAKLEECRRGVPTASKAGALVGVDKHVIGGVELYLMQLVNWAPLADWKDRPLQLEDDSWY